MRSHGWRILLLQRPASMRLANEELIMRKFLSAGDYAERMPGRHVAYEEHYAARFR